MLGVLLATDDHRGTIHRSVDSNPGRVYHWARGYDKRLHNGHATAPLFLGGKPLTMEVTLDLSTIFEQETFTPDSYEAVKEIGFAGPESINRLLELLHNLEKQAEEGGGNTGAQALKLGKFGA